MSTITLSDLPSIVKIHGLAHAQMIHDHGPIPDLLAFLGPLLDEKAPELMKDYQGVEACFRDNLRTHQEAGWVLEGCTQQILAFNKAKSHVLRVCASGCVMPSMKVPLKHYHKLVHKQRESYALLHYPNLTIRCALSSMCAQDGCKAGSIGAFGVQQLRDGFKASEAFTGKMLLLLKVLDGVLVQILASDERGCVSGMALLLKLATAYASVSLEEPSKVATPRYRASRLGRLKKAQAAHRERVRREAEDKNPEEESFV